MEGRGQRRSDAHQQEWSAWDASDAAHPVVILAEEPLRPELAGADAERWVVRALDVRVPDACRREHPPGLLERPDAVAELYTRGAVRSAEQSCVAPALSEPEALQQPGAAQQAELVVQQKQSLQAKVAAAQLATAETLAVAARPPRARGRPVPWASQPEVLAALPGGVGQQGLQSEPEVREEVELV